MIGTAARVPRNRERSGRSRGESGPHRLRAAARALCDVGRVVPGPHWRPQRVRSAKLAALRGRRYCRYLRRGGGRYSAGSSTDSSPSRGCSPSARGGRGRGPGSATVVRCSAGAGASLHSALHSWRGGPGARAGGGGGRGGGGRGGAERGG